MTREEFWMQEFSKCATEEVDRVQNACPEDLATNSAKWADLALAEYDKRF